MNLTSEQIATIEKFTNKRFDQCFEDLGDELTESDVLGNEVDSDNDEEWVAFRDAIERVIHAEILKMYTTTKQEI